MCLATNPLPIRYSWTKDGQTIRDATNIKVYRNILVVVPRKLKDFGTYVCNATNIAGSTNYSIELIQKTKENIIRKYRVFLHFLVWLQAIKWNQANSVNKIEKISNYSYRYINWHLQKDRALESR